MSPTLIYIVLVIILIIGVLLLINASDYTDSTQKNMYIAGGVLVGLCTMILIGTVVYQATLRKREIGDFYKESLGALTNRQKAIIASANNEVRRNLRLNNDLKESW